MDTHTVSIKETQEALSCSRSTVYTNLAKLSITPKKKGRKAYITPEELKALKETVHIDTHKNNSNTSENVSPNKTKDNNSLVEHLKTQLKTEQEQNKRLQEKNEALQQEKQVLSREIGEWEGKAKAYQEQTTLLLQERRTQAETIQAEIIEDESPTKPRTFTQKWRDFWDK